jgi:hypothetical protein
LRLARALRRDGQMAAAQRVIAQLLALPDLPPDLLQAAQLERAQLRAGSRDVPR